MTVPTDLVADLALLSLDAGNTIVFLDHAATAHAATAAGFPLDADAFERAEGLAKRKLEAGPHALGTPMSDPEIPPTWSLFMRTAVQIATDFDLPTSEACVRALWRAHREFNLWRRVPDGLVDAVRSLRTAGVPVCIVSNSEGRLHHLLGQLHILDAFDHVIDSHVLGIEKPDPRIFQHALQRFGVPADQSLHLGDVVAVDVVGARGVGMRTALIDPFGHYEGAHPDVPRVTGVADVAHAIMRSRTERTR